MFGTKLQLFIWCSYNTIGLCCARKKSEKFIKSMERISLEKEENDRFLYMTGSGIVGAQVVFMSL